MKLLSTSQRSGIRVGKSLHMLDDDDEQSLIIKRDGLEAT